MHYSIEPRDRRCVKGNGFLPFLSKNIGKNVTIIGIVKNLLTVLKSL